MEQQLEENTRVISDGIKELNECRRKLAQIIDQYNNLSRSLATISSLIDQLRLEAGKKLVKNIASKDDVQAVLKKETLSLQDWQKRLSNLIAEKQERLTEFENRLGNIKIIGDIIQLGEKRKNLEQIQQSPAFLELEAIRDEIATWVADLEAIQQAISMASQKEAQGKVQAAEKTIDNFFRKLTQHPAVSRIHLNVQEGRQGRNTYDISDGQGGDLTPLLSQGDLNALALAIFLGLTVTGGEGFPLGFVILDDPSQSLGSEYKRRLAQVLNEICEHKEVLIATMDQEFCGHIKERMTKNKTEYLFGEWTPEAGPTITRGK